MGLNQCPPGFQASGTGFLEDNFSMNEEGEDGFGIIQAHYIYFALYFL